MKRKYSLAAAALSTLAIASLSLPALAADTPPIGGPGATNPALINDAATGALHITKYSGGDNGMPADGSQGGAPTNPLNTPLPGVTYAIYQVPGVNLTTSAGWEAAVSYYNNMTGAWTAVSAVTPVTATTNANGQADFATLPLGLYLVEEVSAPAGYTMAAPFLVTLPMTDPEGPDGDPAKTEDNNTSWMYDVYVYPKNQQDTITLTVADLGSKTTDETTGVAADHLVDYTLTSSIPDGTVPLNMYVVQQDLDPTVTFTGADITVGATTLVRGTDYNIYYATDASTAATLWDGVSPVPAGAVITVVFTDTGLGILQTNRDQSVVTVLHTTVGLQDTIDGIVPAQASLIPSEAWWQQNCVTCTVNPENPIASPPGTALLGIDSGTVESKYGDLAITKTDAQSAAVVPGAEFTVYRDADNSETCTDAELIPANVVTGPVATDAAGLLRIDGLQTSDWYDGGTQSDLYTYCLVETKAPAGYSILADPIAFTILSTSSAMTTNLPIKNEKANLGNNLPLTGGEGVAALSLGGLLLIGGGAGYYAFTSRKRRTA